jgi:uncharacterized small protein (DUF1192 family)
MRNLNKPPRYNVASIQAQQTLGGDVMQSAEDGQYVEWRDYTWLLKEVERLKAEIADEKSANEGVEGRLNSANRGLSMRNHLLQAEVERLRKAGDAMASSIQFNEEMAKDYNGPTIVHQCVQRWNAAKDGKQP